MMRAAGTLRGESKRWHSLSTESIVPYQLARLRQFLKQQVLPFHPFYGPRFRELGLDAESFRTLADLERLPLTTKADVAPTKELPDRPRDFVLQPTPESLRASLPLGRKLGLATTRLIHGAEAVRQQLSLEYRPVQVYFTTGRTSLPTSFFMTRYDLGILDEAGRRIAEVATVDPAVDRIVSMFPYAPHLAFWQVQSVGVASGTFVLQTGGGKVMGSDGILRAIRKVRPSFLAGIPGYVYHLVRDAVEAGEDLSFVRRIFLGGDRVAPGFREKLIELLGRGGAREPRIVSVLGFTEAKKCWTECPGGPQYGFHTYPDLDLFEIVDPDTGKSLPDHETGELVYTPLDSRGTLVLRYRTGDIVAGGIMRERCAGCGRTVPRFGSDLSRRSNIKDFSLTKIKGALVNLNAMVDLLNGHAGIDEWQLVIRKRNNDPFEIDELALALALAAGHAEDRVVADIEKQLVSNFELRPSVVEVLPRAELLRRTGMETQLKENRILDLREPAPKPAAPPSAAAAVTVATTSESAKSSTSKRVPAKGK
ncbi:MAG: phenylacetate--CoA ligase family protein [Planctomycetota bacterium]